MAHPNVDTSATKEAIRMLRSELTLDFHKLANTNPVAEINAKITDLTREVSRVAHQKVTSKISPAVAKSLMATLRESIRDANATLERFGHDAEDHRAKTDRSIAVLTDHLTRNPNDMSARSALIGHHDDMYSHTTSTLEERDKMLLDAMSHLGVSTEDDGVNERTNEDKIIETRRT